LPAGAGGKQTRGGKVRQGREECRGNEDGRDDDGPAEAARFRV
jgi:hypothetical protein